jgi:hypothetical protein
VKGFGLSSNCRDWNQTVLSILGDISIGVPVTVFDDAQHYDPDVHAIPYEYR